MIALTIILSSIAWTICAKLRAPIGFQTDRGFFYGIPDESEADRKAAAHWPEIGVGGGADLIHHGGVNTDA